MYKLDPMFSIFSVQTLTNVSNMATDGTSVMPHFDFYSLKVIKQYFVGWRGAHNRLKGN